MWNFSAECGGFKICFVCVLLLLLLFLAAAVATVHSA